jgi:hypothetical protein
MRIEVDTRFNIGDMVYVPEPHICWMPIPEPSQVTGIKIKYRLENGGKMNQIVLYELSNEFHPVNADLCFATFEECNQWCAEQNEKEGWQ